MKKNKQVFYGRVIAMILIFACVLGYTTTIFAQEITDEYNLVELNLETGERAIVSVPYDVTACSSGGPINPYALSPSVIIGEDERTRVEGDGREYGDNLYLPFSAIGALNYKKNDISYYGTGSMVYSNIGISAAHCFYSSKGVAEDITFTPGINGSYQPFGQTSVSTTTVYYPEEWEESFDPNYDWAIFITNTSIGNNCGWLGCSLYSSLPLDNDFLLISGYPSDCRSIGYAEQWFHEAEFTSQNTYKFYYPIDTTEGQSGSPLVVWANQQYYAVGIHTKGDETNNINSGCKITPASLSLINSLR